MNKKQQSAGPKNAEKQNVIIETPRGSRNKYKYQDKTGRIKFSKVLPEGMMFPYDFGFIPHTKASDGDPLDVLVLSDEPTFPGCEVECRIIGALRATQREKGKENRNDRLIAVAEGSVLYAGVNELSDLEPAVLQQIEQFFTNYQRVRNIEFQVIERSGPQAALALLRESTKKAA
ncbi:MAG: inorganic diphosphatase [Acidobacteria bacterium]|nr:inorganic diphosphatase [Acidobacteriota bacterium]